MSCVRVVFGDQLFPLQHLEAPSAGPILMIEDPFLCTTSMCAEGLTHGYRHHQQKIVLYLAAMRSYRDELREAGYRVIYVDLVESIQHPTAFAQRITASLKAEQATAISYFTPSDRSTRQMMDQLIKYLSIPAHIQESPGFVTPLKAGVDWLSQRKQLKLGDFYKWQRQRLGVLLVDDRQPVGGKWSFDEANRQALPADVFPPQAPVHSATSHVADVVNLVKQHFSHHPGSCDSFNWPTTRQQAQQQLAHFIEHRLATFGPYQDALTARSETVFHSLLTPALNTGLLTPDEVLRAALSQQDKVPLASLEGFIRQVIGWREFLFSVDRLHGEAQHASNHFNHQSKLSDAWYTGETGLPPLDAMIHKCQQSGYAHHIERLMVAGNVMLLAGIHPHEAHRWFMEMFIDSAEWVMGPNVYGMALFSDGGLFATKPYCCGSSYWKKQAGREAKAWDHAYGKEWGDGLDGLYWDFIERNANEFSKNHRMQRQVWSLGRLRPERRHKINTAAENLLSVLCRP